MTLRYSFFILSLFLSISNANGDVQLKALFPVDYGKKNHIRSSFCPLMSFRQGACIGKFIRRIQLFISSLGGFYSATNHTERRIHFLPYWVWQELNIYCLTKCTMSYLLCYVPTKLFILIYSLISLTKIPSSVSLTILPP